MQTIRNIIDSFIRHAGRLAEAGEYKPASLRSYRTIARLYFDEIADRDASTLRPRDVREWMLSVAEEVRDRQPGRKGTTTANRAKVVLDLALRLAIEDEQLPPAARITRQVRRLREEPRSRYLSPEEVAAVQQGLRRVERLRVRQALPSLRQYAYSPTQALLLISLTGLRLNEALRLRVDEVDLGARILKLKHSKRGFREVPLSFAAASLLRAQLARAEDGWVFPSPRSALGPTVHPYAVWRQALVASGIDTTDVVIHTLRHSLVTWLLRQGYDLKVAADLAGHSDLDVTRSIYGRPLATVDAIEAINRFAEAVGAQQPEKARAA